MTKAQLINKYTERILVDYPETDKIHIDLQQFAEELPRTDTMTWYDVESRPLFTETNGVKTTTDDGLNEFIAAVAYKDTREPEKLFWWIHHCVIEDHIGLCIVGDFDNEPACWGIEEVSFWMPWPSAPIAIVKP